MVINLVASMLWASPVTMIFAALIFVGGHMFNLAINALGAYVHSCRLQYIEFFSRFYEDGGTGEFARVIAGTEGEPEYGQTCGWRVGTLMMTCEGTRIQDERGNEQPTDISPSAAGQP